MSKHSIDDIIKKALEKIESNPRNADWDSFESMLDGNDLTNFDHFVKDNLEKVAPPADGAWNKFEDNYAEELGNEHPVDEVIKDNLKGHEAAFVENSWARLSALLDLTDRRERELLIKKVVEVCAVSLILFLLIPQFFDNDGNRLQNDHLQYAQQEQEANQDAENQELYEEEHSSTNDQEIITGKNEQGTENIAQSTAPENDASTASASTVGMPDDSEKPSTHYRSEKEFSALVPLSVYPAGKLKVDATTSAQKITSTDFAENHQGNLLSDGLSLVATQTESAFSEQQVEDVPYLPLLPLEEDGTEYYPQVQLVEPEKPSHTTIAVFAAPQFTHIYTPKDDVYTDPKLNIQPFGRVRLFNAMGLEIEKQHNEFSIGGNISYSTLDYRPPTIVEKYDGSISVVDSDTIRNGYRELSLVNLELQMASVSLFMRQYFPLSQNMRLFAHLGGGINMVMKSNYLIHNITNKGNGKRLVEEYEFNGDEENAAIAHVKLREKNFEGGILEGGNFNRNSYMDIEFGGGLEYDLNEECSVYIASVMNYSPFSDGLGPNRDKINSLNFQIGVKQSL